MKKIVVFIFFLLYVSQILGQCKEYIRTIAAEAIKPYNLDMHFFAPVVQEGEKIKYTRSFIKGNRYIIKVIGLDFLEKKIKITDEDGILLFANYPIRKKINDLYFIDYQGAKVMWLGSNYFEFVPQRSENLVITVKIERKARLGKNRLKGCMGIIVGYLPLTNKNIEK